MVKPLASYFGRLAPSPTGHLHLGHARTFWLAAERARAAGVLLQVGHVERFNRAVRAAMPFVDAPRFIESDRLAPFNPRGSDVAVVLDLMIHDLDLVHTLVGLRVADVQAMGGQRWDTSSLIKRLK